MKRKIKGWLVCGAVFAGILTCCAGTVVYAEETQETTAYEAFVNKIVETESICGVIYIGPVDWTVEKLEKDRLYLEKILSKYTADANYEFLKDIPGDRMIEMKNGAELFCIIPADPNASVAVNSCELNYETSELEFSGILYRSDYGEPILLRCNASEMFRDTEVLIVDNCGKILEWNPGISLMDGRVDVTVEGFSIYDGTIYKDMPEMQNTSENTDEISEIEELDTFLEVVNCKEWVSLREYPDAASIRLMEVPLGAAVVDYGVLENGFALVNFNGLDGYIDIDYLK